MGPDLKWRHYISMSRVVPDGAPCQFSLFAVRWPRAGYNFVPSLWLRASLLRPVGPLPFLSSFRSPLAPRQLSFLRLVPRQYLFILRFTAVQLTLILMGPVYLLDCVPSSAVISDLRPTRPTLFESSASMVNTFWLCGQHGQHLSACGQHFSALLPTLPAPRSIRPTHRPVTV